MCGTRVRVEMSSGRSRRGGGGGGGGGGRRGSAPTRYSRYERSLYLKQDIIYFLGTFLCISSR